MREKNDLEFFLDFGAASAQAQCSYVCLDLAIKMLKKKPWSSEKAKALILKMDEISKDLRSLDDNFMDLGPGDEACGDPK